jgi:hypothetical protein
LIFLPAAALALTAMLVAGCGGGGDRRPKVEAGLRDYFSTISPEDSILPYGAGPPNVKDNGCKDLHRKLTLLPPGRKFPLLPPSSTKFKEVVLWRCFVRFENFTLTVQIAVNDSNEVVWAVPVYGDPRKAPPLSPARTYTG